MLIKTYGEFWSRDCIITSRRQIAGRRKNNKLNCNVWDQRGIYALYENFKIVYVGQADDRGIGRRLSEHCKDRFRKRWDSFSWFGVCEFDSSGKARPYVRRSSPQSDTIRSLELLAILVSDAPLNRQQGKFPGAEKVWEVSSEKITDVSRKLDEILEEVRSLKGVRRRKIG